MAARVDQHDPQNQSVDIVPKEMSQERSAQDKGAFTK